VLSGGSRYDPDLRRRGDCRVRVRLESRAGIEALSTTALNTPPLIVDLDGTLVRTDLLHESTLKLLRARPYLLLALPWWLASGKAALKRQISERASVEVSVLPYDEQVLAWLQTERAAGRSLVLCTASDERYANAIAAHLGIFDSVIASDGERNLSAAQKAVALVERFGEQGFDYAGNSRADLAVWERARRAIVVAARPAVSRAAHATSEVEREFGREAGNLITWIRALRIYQWLKNLLLFLPMLGAHQIFEPGLLADAVQAFFAFGLCTSSAYVINDLMDWSPTAITRTRNSVRSRPAASRC
jgi:phosphoserine phosphatase